MANNGLTSEQLAIQAGVAKGTVDSIRCGRSDPRRPTIVWIAAAATRLLRRTVEARELFDLGDDE